MLKPVLLITLITTIVFGTHGTQSQSSASNQMISIGGNREIDGLVEKFWNELKEKTIETEIGLREFIEGLHQADFNTVDLLNRDLALSLKQLFVTAIEKGSQAFNELKGTYEEMRRPFEDLEKTFQRI